MTLPFKLQGWKPHLLLGLFFCVAVIVVFVVAFSPDTKNETVKESRPMGSEVVGQEKEQGSEAIPRKTAADANSNADYETSDVSEDDQTAKVSRDAKEEKMPLSDEFPEYRRLVSELEAEVDAYRSSWPVFENFYSVYAGFVIPLALRAERVRLEMAVAGDDAGESSEVHSDYDEALAREAVYDTLSSAFGDVARGAGELVRSGSIGLSEEEAERFAFVLRMIEDRKGGPHVPDNLGNPYREGTPEHQRFLRELSYVALVFSAALAAPLQKLPAELVEKERRVKEFYDLHVSATARARDGCPPKYVDKYLDSLDKEHIKIAEYTDLFWEITKATGSIADGFLQDAKGGPEP